MPRPWFASLSHASLRIPLYLSVAASARRVEAASCILRLRVAIGCRSRFGTGRRTSTPSSRKHARLGRGRHCESQAHESVRPSGALPRNGIGLGQVEARTVEILSSKSVFVAKQEEPHLTEGRAGAAHVSTESSFITTAQARAHQSEQLFCLAALGVGPRRVPNASS